MRRPGKPLVFLGQVVGGWIALRALLMFGTEAAPMAEPLAPTAAVPQMDAARQPDAARADVAAPARTAPAHVWPAHGDRSSLPRPALAAAPAARPPLASGAPRVGASPVIPAVHALDPQAASVSLPPAETAVLPAAARGRGQSASPWTLTGWLLWRPDGESGLATGPLLGGSQAGARLDYRLWAGGGRSLSLYGRVSRALRRPFAEEAALGISIRPDASVPIALLAERRMRLGPGGRTGVALFAAGGIGPRPVAPRLTLEGYAQAGMVGFPGSDGFADGSLALDYRLTRPAEPDLGVGLLVAGSAQPDAARLDVGPQLRVRLPVAGGHVRLTAEWRQRVAGRARPRSGPVLTLVTDF